MGWNTEKNYIKNTSNEIVLDEEELIASIQIKHIIGSEYKKKK